jgi:hypothetical protein
VKNLITLLLLGAVIAAYAAFGLLTACVPAGSESAAPLTAGTPCGKKNCGCGCREGQGCSCAAAARREAQNLGDRK